MYLKQEVDPVAFLKQVQRCRDKVELVTGEGDCLDLRSALARYLFIAASSNRKLMQHGEIICRDEEDYGELSDYLQPVKGEPDAYL